VEYGLLVALIAVVIAATVYALGTALSTKLSCTKNVIAQSTVTSQQNC
jgi:Flp pilus assembly pilin Flp